MKVCDLFEDIGSDLDQDLADLITVAKGSGMTEIDTNKIVQQLLAMGYSVSPETIVALIQKNGQATDASLEKITLTSNTDPNSQGQDPDMAKDKVEQMAITSGMKGLQK